MSFLDRYATRANHVQVFPRIWQLNAFQFVQQYLFGKVGKREACTGHTRVCLGGANRIDDLLIVLVAFDTMARLDESAMLKARLQEELRLQ